MESITQMYKISKLANPKTCALGWLPFFLSELPIIDERIEWLHQAQVGDSVPYASYSEETGAREKPSAGYYQPAELW